MGPGAIHAAIVDESATRAAFGWCFSVTVGCIACNVLARHLVGCGFFLTHGGGKLSLLFEKAKGKKAKSKTSKKSKIICRRSRVRSIGQLIFRALSI